MKIRILIALFSVMLLSPIQSAFAHFGMAIASDTMVMAGDNRDVQLTFSFSHPFDGQGMPLNRPKIVAVAAGAKRVDLQNRLKSVQVMGNKAWSATYRINRPGVYQFFMEPQPYWEPAEDSFIIHYTKTVIGAFGNEEGWDQALGLKTEIVPLSRPFGLYTGNIFRAMVMLDGKPVSHAGVEIEYFNQDGHARATTDFMVTQTVKTDANGIFAYSPPVSGWWGFAALSEGDFKIKHDGIDKDVEIGAVIWVWFHDWETK